MSILHGGSFLLMYPWADGQIVKIGARMIYFLKISANFSCYRSCRFIIKHTGHSNGKKAYLSEIVVKMGGKVYNFTPSPPPPPKTGFSYEVLTGLPPKCWDYGVHHIFPTLSPSLWGFVCLFVVSVLFLCVVGHAALGLPHLRGMLSSTEFFPQSTSFHFFPGVESSFSAAQADLEIHSNSASVSQVLDYWYMSPCLSCTWWRSIYYLPEEAYPNQFGHVAPSPILNS